MKASRALPPEAADKESGKSILKSCFSRPVVRCEACLDAACSADGRITQRKDWLPGEEVEYQYDSLQRLSLAATTGTGGWGQSFGYDGFGNLLSQTVTKGNAPSMSVNVNPATNRITNTGMSYDANGNLTAMPGLTMTYDVSNRLTSATQRSTDQYFYDPAGRRVFRNGLICFYGVDGSLLGEYTPAWPEGYSALESSVYFGKRLLWRGSGYGFFWAGTTTNDDRLGSVVYDGTAAPKYFPYGDEPTTTAQNRSKFATYYRDGTTGLDYAQQRYYASTLGRFTTPDPYQASGGPADPQSWNRYAYVQNDPVNYSDPEGLQFCPVQFGRCDSVTVSASMPGAVGFISGFGFGRAPVAHLLPKDGGGGGGGGAPSGPPKPDAMTDSFAQYILGKAIDALRTTRCNEVLSLDAIASKGQQMHFYDARPSSPYAAVKQDYVSGNGDMTTLGNTPIGYPGADAALLRGQDGSHLPVVVLRTNWWGAMSGDILLHETMHYALQRTDGEMFKYLGQRGFRFNGDANDTDQISGWLDAGCPNENGTRRPTDRIGRHTW